MACQTPVILPHQKLTLHGENTVQSRNRLFQLIAEANAKQQRVVRLEAKQLDLPNLEIAISGESLFGEEKIVVIEELHSLPTSKRKDELIKYLGSTHLNSLILWEKRDLTPTMLKKFPTAKQEQFKVTNVLFKWLDSLSGNSRNNIQSLPLLHQALEKDGDFMCLTMLIRQIRLLISAKEDRVEGLPPFMVGKLKKQATSFSLEQLLKIHHQLLQIDIEEKTSATNMTLSQKLKLFLVTL